MTSHYVVELELDIPHTSGHSEVDAALTALELWHPAARESAAGTLEVTVTLPAESLVQAVAAAVSVAESNVGPVVGLSVLPEEVRDQREGWHTIDELIPVGEAAAILDVSRQRVLQMIGEGKLPRRRIGREYALPRAAVQALQRRSTPSLD